MTALERKGMIVMLSRKQKLAIVCLCMGVFVGCANQNVPEGGTRVENVPQTDSDVSSQTSLLDHATLEGAVLEFDSTGFLLNQAKDIDGGAGMMVADAGSEKREDAITVIYQPSCEFIMATLNAQSGTITKEAPASADDIKKQMNVFIYGEFSQNHQFEATKVVMVQWE